ncbi:MAG: hypothetical protein ACJ76H_00860 [Bacteriovoracaceae bacterium]
MKKIIFTLLVMLASLTSFANEVYFKQERMEKFACQVAQSIKASYPEMSLHDFRKKLLNILRIEINPWVDANPIPAGISLPDFISKYTGLPGFPMDRSEYWLPNAFILLGNPKLELQAPVENYLESFYHLARLRQVKYLNGEAPAFNLRKEEDLLQQIEEHLPVVANYEFPYQDKNGNPIEQKNAKKPFTLAIGNPQHKKYNEFVPKASKFNEFASPLTVWLLKQKEFSVSPEKLFEKAVEIYGDPMVALGVIAWITSGDALVVNRGNSSVLTYKIERLTEGEDVPGLQYHFWGYLTQGFAGNKLRVGTMAYFYEVLYQHDDEDWTSDSLSLRTSTQIRKSFKHPEICL